jgi:hypothetical protein
MRKCQRCGKLFSGTPDQIRCSACTRLNLDAALKVDEAVDRLGLRTVAEIAEATALPPAQVLSIVRETAALRELVDTGEICQRCRKLPAQSGSRYCSGCRMALTRAFEQATSRLMDRLVEIAAERQEAPSATVMRMSVNEALNRKRRLGRGSRFDPTPHNRYSG